MRQRCIAVVLDRDEARLVRPVLEDPPLAHQLRHGGSGIRADARAERDAGGCGRRSRSSRAARSRGAAPSRGARPPFPLRDASGVALSLHHAAADLCEADGRERLRHVRTRAVAAASTSSARDRLRPRGRSRRAARRRAATTCSASIRHAPEGERFLRATFQEAELRRRVGRGRRRSRAAPREPARRGPRPARLARAAPRSSTSSRGTASTRRAQDWYEGQHRMLRAAGAEPYGPRDLDEWRVRHPDLHAHDDAARGVARALRRARARVGAVLPPLARRPERARRSSRRSIGAGAIPGDRLPLGGRRARRRRAPRRRRGSPRRASPRGSSRQLAALGELLRDVGAADQLAVRRTPAGSSASRRAPASSWRIAGSGRMFTAVTGAPASRSARSARSELPHITNCGRALHEERDRLVLDDVLDLSVSSLMTSLSS